jgi:hypothetical protein
MVSQFVELLGEFTVQPHVRCGILGDIFLCIVLIVWLLVHDGHLFVFGCDKVIICQVTTRWGPDSEQPPKDPHPPSGPPSSQDPHWYSLSFSLCLSLSRVPKSLMIGRLIKFLTSFTQPTRLKLNSCVGLTNVTSGDCGDAPPHHTWVLGK